jgi:hypothetical protein
MPARADREHAQGGGQAGIRPGQVIQQTSRSLMAEKVGIEPTTYVRNIYKYYVASRCSISKKPRKKRARRSSKMAEDFGFA